MEEVEFNIREAIEADLSVSADDLAIETDKLVEVTV